MLRWRLLLGTVFVAAIVGLCWLDAGAEPAGIYLLPLGLVITALAAQEVVGLFSAREERPVAWVIYAGSLLVVASNVVPMFWWPNPLGLLGWPLAGFAAALLLAFVGEILRYDGRRRVLPSLGLSLLGVAYVGLLMTFVVQLRLLGPRATGGASDRWGEWGIPALAALIAIVKLGDTGAYTVGRLVGRHKMTPQLSPGKTWEGAAGAFVFAVLGAWLTLGWLLPPGGAPVPFGSCAVLGLVVGLAGMLGDLAESLMKRDAGRKESSTWMPGFGGVLDVMDSILLAAPVAYLAWALGLVHTY